MTQNYCSNWIHPAATSLNIWKSLDSFSASDLNKIEQIVELWFNADKSRENPRQVLQHFGDGLAIYLTLPEKIKVKTNVYVMSALGEASFIANQNRISVTFDATGPIFS